MLEALMCLALNVYHEAKNQSFIGQVAVAQVVMNRYYVEMEHPRGKEDYGTFYIYIKAYDSQQIIDMIDGVIVHIEQTFE